MLFGEVGFLVLIGRCRVDPNQVVGLPMSGAPNGAPEGADVLPKLGWFLWKELLVGVFSKSPSSATYFLTRASVAGWTTCSTAIQTWSFWTFFCCSVWVCCGPLVGWGVCGLLLQ